MTHAESFDQRVEALRREVDRIIEQTSKASRVNGATMALLGAMTSISVVGGIAGLVLVIRCL